MPAEYRLVEPNGLDNNSPYRDYKGLVTSELPAVEPPAGFVQDDVEQFNRLDGRTVTVRAWAGLDEQLGVKCWVQLETPPASPAPDALGPPLAEGTFRTSARCSQDED